MFKQQYSWVRDHNNGPKRDYTSRAAAIARLLRERDGEVWTSDGCHLVAWIEGRFLKTVDLRSHLTYARAL